MLRTLLLSSLLLTSIPAWAGKGSITGGSSDEPHAVDPTLCQWFLTHQSQLSTDPKTEVFEKLGWSTPQQAVAAQIVMNEVGDLLEGVKSILGARVTKLRPGEERSLMTLEIPLNVAPLPGTLLAPLGAVFRVDILGHSEVAMMARDRAHYYRQRTYFLVVQPHVSEREGQAYVARAGEILQGLWKIAAQNRRKNLNVWMNVQLPNTGLLGALFFADRDAIEGSTSL